MANGNDNDLLPSPKPVHMLAPDVGKRAVASALWEMAKGAYGLMQVPGKVYSGELTPTVMSPVEASLEPGGRLLSVPDYAFNLGTAGFGVGSVVGGAPLGALETFPAWHGTGMSKPFERFENRFLGTGEGATIPSLIGEHAWGHYISGVPTEARGYQQSVGRHREGGGSFLSLNVKPEQEHLLEWNKPFSQQSDYVQERLLKSNIGDVLADPYGSIRNRNGGGLYRGIMNKIYGDFERAAYAEGRDTYMSSLDMKKAASQHLDSIGIPGMKYEIGGYVGPDHLAYEGNSLSFPDAVSDQIYDDPEKFHNKFIAPAKGDVGKAVDSMISELDSNGHMVQQLHDGGENPHDYDLNADPNHYDYGAQWLQNHKDEFKIYRGATPHNYVIFDGRHIDITHWDGQQIHQLFPVDHDPFAGTGSEAEWRLPPSQQMYVSAPKEPGSEGISYSYSPPPAAEPAAPAASGWTPEPMYPYQDIGPQELPQVDVPAWKKLMDQPY